MRHFLDDTVASCWFLEYSYMNTQIRILTSNTLAISRFWSNANSTRIAFQRLYYGYNKSIPHHPAFAVALSSAGALPRNDPATNRIVQQCMTQNISCVFLCDTKNRNMSGNISESQQSQIFRIDVQLTKSVLITTPHHSTGTHLVQEGVLALAMAPPKAAAPHCNTLQHTLTCLFQQRSRLWVSFRIHLYFIHLFLYCSALRLVQVRLQHTTTHYNTLQHTAITHCSLSSQHPSLAFVTRPTHEMRHMTLHHAATRCNTLQHTATYACSRLGSFKRGRMSHVTHMHA